MANQRCFVHQQTFDMREFSTKRGEDLKAFNVEIAPIGSLSGGEPSDVTKFRIGSADRAEAKRE